MSLFLVVCLLMLTLNEFYKEYFMKFNKIELCFFLLIACLGTSAVFAQNPSKYPKKKDNLTERQKREWIMYRNPGTQQIPQNIRNKELTYTYSSRAQLLPAFKNRNARTTSLNYKQRGPYNVGGRTRALAIDKSNENIILAGGVSGGMWRSTDGGTSWTKTTGASQLHSVTDVYQDPNNTDVWYYATGEIRGNSASGGSAPYRGNGVFKSTDGGVTWVNLPGTATDPTASIGGLQYITRIRVNPVNSHVYAAAYDGIHRSTDGGTSWTKVFDAPTAVNPYLEISATGIIYAAIPSTSANKGIKKSTDGTTWNDITPAGLATKYTRVALAIAPSNENVMFVFAYTPKAGTDNHQLFYTGDGGVSWSDRTTNLPSGSASVAGNLSQGWYNLLIKVKPDDANMVFIGSTNLYRSTDGFSTTTNTTWIAGYSPLVNGYSWYPNHHPDNHALVFYADPKRMLSGHDGGVSRTEDNTANNPNYPVSWTYLANGYYTTQAYSVAIDPVTSGDTRFLLGLQDSGNWYVRENSATTPWSSEIGGGDGGFAEMIAGKNTIYLSTQNGAVFRAVRDANFNLTNSDHVHPKDASGQLFINPFILDRNDQNIMYYPAGTSLWRHNQVNTIETGWNWKGTNDAGWTKVTSAEVTDTITALESSKATPNILYYGTKSGKLYKLTNANVGTAPARTDIYTGKGLPTGAYVSCISVDEEDVNKVLVVFSNYGVKSVFYSIDGGATWADVSGNLEENPDGTGNGPSVRWVETYRTPNGAMYYFAGTSTGLYLTRKLDGTNTDWVQQSADLIGNIPVTMIQARSSDGLIAIGTHGSGGFSTTIVDNQAPTIAKLSPANNEPKVKKNTDLTLTFDENIIKGTGNITVKKTSDQAMVETVDVSSNQVTANGKTLTIRLQNDLPAEQQVYVEMATGTVKDTRGNSFAGISSATQWTFTAQDVTLPQIVGLSPANGAMNVALTPQLTMTFQKDIKVGTGNIVLKKNSDNSTRETMDITGSQVKVTGKKVSISLTNPLMSATQYYVEIASSALTDLEGNAFAGINDNTTWTFTTLDTAVPLVSKFEPANGSTNVPLNTSLVLAFQDKIVVGTGNINLRKYNDGSIISSFDVTGNQVTIDNNKVTIAWKEALLPGTQYYVEIPQGVLKNVSGTAYSGISDKNTWSFTSEQTTTSISLGVLQRSLKIFPNPASKYVKIQLNQARFKLAKAELYNSLGHLVREKLVQASSRGNALEETIDLSKLPKGNYVLKVITPQHVITKNLVIQ